MRDNDPLKEKKKIEALILYEILLMAGCLGLFLLNVVLIRRSDIFVAIGVLFLVVLSLMTINLARYRRLLNSTPGEKGKSVLASLKRNLWDRA